MTRTISTGGALPSVNSGHDRVDDLHAVVSARLNSVVISATSLGNVVPFMRPKTGDHGRGGPALVLPSDLVRTPSRSAAEHARLAAYILLSLLIHGSLVALLWRDPPPLASIGVEVISVELVLGATAPAGVAPTTGENEVQSASAAEMQPAESETLAERATEQSQDVKVASREVAPEAPLRVHPAADKEEAVALDAKPIASQPAVAMTPTPEFETPTATPQDEPAPSEQFSTLPQPQKTRPEPTVEQQPQPKQELKKTGAPKPVKDAAPAKERRRIAAPTRDKHSDGAKPSTPSSQANNVGLGRSSNDTNYRGLVAAHLARYKQYPADARNRGDGGTASVSFTIGGSGGVTSVRLARSSGIASIDAEVQAMVRRASPFPSPPGARAQNFTVPVSFRLN